MPRAASSLTLRCLAAVGTIAIVGGGLLAASPALAASSAVPAAPSTQLVLTRVGTPATTLVDGPSPVSLVSVNSDGSASSVPNVDLPIAQSGANQPFALSGTSDAQGSLSRAADGSGLSLGGYAGVPDPTAGDPGDTASAAFQRVVAWVPANGVPDTSTVVTDKFDAGNIRSVATADGHFFYVAGKGGKETPTVGIVSATLGSTTPGIITDKDKNVRTVSIAGGNLYTTSDKTSPVGLSRVATGLPSAAIGATVTPLADTTAIKAGKNPATPDGFGMLDNDGDGAPDTAYVIEETVGIYKFALVGGSWQQQGSIAGTFESITGAVTSVGDVLYTLAGTDEGNALVSYTDTAASASAISVGAPTTVATAPAGTVYRGVAFAPTGWNPPAAPGGGNGGGGSTPSTGPTIVPAASGLPQALGDPANSTLPIVLGSENDVNRLTVAVTANSKQAVADVRVTGTGANRMLAATPHAVGITVVTLTVTDPVSGLTATTKISVGVSGNASALDTPRYHSGVADSSTVVEVGGGYMLVANDEDSVIRLYAENTSGAPVKSWDFAPKVGNAELDLEASVRVGDTIYWSGSMSNSKKAVFEPGRNVFFSTTVSGSGANTELAFVGQYRGLRDELISWDHANADRLGLSAACAEGTGATLPDVIGGCNLEGLEFAPGSTTAAYLGLRAPVVGGKAVIVPVTNYSSLIGSAADSATFGSPILLDLGGRSIRELRAGANGQYLITAGAPDDAAEGLGWALYRWNGEPGEKPTLLTTMGSDSGAAAQEAGSYESIVSVPATLVAGTRVQLLTDNGTTAFYGDDVEGKDISPFALQKSVSEWVTIAEAAETPASASASSVTAGRQLTVSASGFSPGETVDLWLHSAPVHLATVMAGANGKVSATVTIPAGTAAGAHSIQLVGARSGVTAVVAIQVAADPTAALAFTGFNAGVPVGFALLLLVGGVVLLVARRRRSA